MISTFFVLGIVSAAPASSESVMFFQGTYKEAMSRAASKKLPLFIDFYTDW